MGPEYEWRDCVGCTATHIEECRHVKVDLSGKPEVPDECCKKDKIIITKKDHNVQSETL
jgi:hypothetical protein